MQTLVSQCLMMHPTTSHATCNQVSEQFWSLAHHEILQCCSMCFANTQQYCQISWCGACAGSGQCHVGHKIWSQLCLTATSPYCAGSCYCCPCCRQDQSRRVGTPSCACISSIGRGADACCCSLLWSPGKGCVARWAVFEGLVTKVHLHGCNTLPFSFWPDFFGERQAGRQTFIESPDK